MEFSQTWRLGDGSERWLFNELAGAAFGGGELGFEAGDFAFQMFGLRQSFKCWQGWADHLDAELLSLDGGLGVDRDAAVADGITDAGPCGFRDSLFIRLQFDERGRCEKLRRCWRREKHDRLADTGG